MLKDHSLPPSPDRCLQHPNGQPDPICDREEPDYDAGKFHRDKFLWLDQVRADPELTPLAFLIAYVLADLVNERTGYAWPSVAFLAAECRATERGVQKIVRQLVERGHLFVDFGQGRGETNRYRWIVRGRDVAQRDKPQRETTSQSRLGESERSWLSPSDTDGRTAVHRIQSKRVNHGSEKGEQRFQEERTPVHPTQSKESIYDPIYRSSSERRAQSPPSRFEEFWRAYPKKVARRDAMSAFADAVRHTSPDDLIRAVVRYAAKRAGEDPRYTKNPATWLNKACWNDPPSASFPLSRAGPRPLRPFDRSALVRLHDEADVDEVLERIRQQTTRRD